MKFTKQVVTPGFYVVNSPDGKRKVQFITQKRINHWATQQKKMQEEGILIPAPDYHNKFGPVKNNSEDQEKVSGSKNNYGFWSDFNVVPAKDDNDNPVLDTEGNQIPALEAVVDVPLDDDVKRIGNTVKETSIVAKNFLDGDGKLWEDVITQVAICTDAIEKGQKNFVPVEEGELAIAMSHRLPIQMSIGALEQELNEPATVGGDLFSLLEKVAGIIIPNDTSPAELVRNLISALKQKEHSDKHSAGGTVTNPPSNSHLHEVPVVMSVNQNGNNGGAAQNGGGTQTAQTTESQQQPQLVDAEVIMSHPAFKQVQGQNQGLLNTLTKSKRTELKNRVRNLRRLGVIGTDDLLTQYEKDIDEFQMSFDDESNPVTGIVESRIEALEQVQIPMPSNPPEIHMAQENDGKYVIQNNPTPSQNNGPVTQSRADEILDGMFGQSVA
jgi:hypothetical protein